VKEILKHAPEQVDYVELNSALLNLAATYLPQDFRESLHAPPVRVVVSDARRFLNEAGHYDLILIGMPEPASGQTNRYYTFEFFEQCAAHLNPDGILAFRLKSAENFWTPQQTRRASSIFGALRAALPCVQVLPGETNIFAASRQPLVRDPSILAGRLETRRIRARLVTAPYIFYIYGNPRFAATEKLLERSTAPFNMDRRPICYQHTVMIWLSRFYPSLGSWDLSSLASWQWLRHAVVWMATAAIALILLMSRRWPLVPQTLFVALAGCIGMSLETVLVLHYQVKSGVIFQDIGLLLMSFMAGLALGSLATDKWTFARAGNSPARHGILLVVGFITLALLIGARIRSGSAETIWVTMAMLIATGYLVAAAFAHASLERTSDQRRAVAPLYAADLIGGCLGSWASSLLLIPAAGLDVAAALMVPLALLSALLVGTGHTRRETI